MRRVVVTGMGCHTPLGHSPDEVFDALLAQKTGAVVMKEWGEIGSLATRIGAPVSDFNGKHIPRKVRRTMGRVSMLAASAAERAIADAGLEREELRDGRTAVVVGSTAGSASAEEIFWDQLITHKSARLIKSTLFFHAMAHTCAANVALYLGINGEMFSTNSACASSSQAIGLAADRIRLGRADCAVAGGAEEISVSAAAIFGSLQAATHTFNDSPDLTPRPFDARRDGIVVGEGAAILVLEERERALARGVPILAEVLGFGTRCDAHHIAAPSPGGMIAAIEACMLDAGRSLDQIDYINAHATGTLTGDASEAQALFDLFGDRVPVSSSKGHMGHTLGACGSIESMVCVQSLRRGELHANRNLDEPNVAPIQLIREAEKRPVQHVLNTNFAFGGVNSVLLFGHGES